MYGTDWVRLDRSPPAVLSAATFPATQQNAELTGAHSSKTVTPTC